MGEWRKIKLKEVLTEINERNKGEKVTTVLSVTNSQGFVSQEEYFEGTVHSENISNYKIVRKNQFAYNPSRVNVGSIDILKNYNEGALSPMYVIFEVDETKLLPGYFKYYFQTHEFFENVKNSTQGSVRNSLSFKSLADFEYLLPPIEEQEKIVKLLKNIDKIIYKYENLLKQKNKFIKFKFNEILENKDCLHIKLIDLIQKGAGLSYGIVVPGEKFENGIPMIRPSDFDKGRLDLSNIYKVNPEVEEKYKKTRLIGDEILIQVIGQPGQVMLANENCKGMNVTRNLAVIRPDKEKINRIFLKEFLELPITQKVLLKNTKQSTLKQLPLNLLKELKVKVPEMDLQNALAEIVIQSDKQKNELEKLIENYKKLKKGLMQKLLTGKIRVKI